MATRYLPHFAAKKLVLLFVFLLTACQPVAVPQTEVTATRTARPSSTPAPSSTPTILPTPTWLVPETALDDVAIRFWHPWMGPAADEMERLASEFNQQNDLGIRVTVTGYGGVGALVDAVQMAGHVGQPPNGVAAPMEQIAGWQAEDGRMVDLDDYLRDADWGLSAAQVGDYLPVFWQEGEGEGGRFSVPAVRGARVIFYNVSWAKELGFPSPPRTPNEFRNQACAAFKSLMLDTDPENNGTGGWVLDRDALTVLSWGYAFGAPESTGADYDFDNSETRAAFGFQRTLLDSSCAWKGRAAEPYAYLSRRQAIFITANLDDVAEQQRIHEYFQSGDEWTVLPFPTIERESFVITSGPSYAVFRSTKAEQLASWAFVRWLMTPSHQARLAQSTGTYPLTRSGLEEMGEYRLQHPQWAAALESLSTSRTRPAPTAASWRVVRYLLEDAAWQSQQPNVKPEQIPEILQMLERAIPELLSLP